MNKVIYASRGGNTKKLAEAIAKGAGTSAVSFDKYDADGGADILFIGASLYAGKIHAKLSAFLATLTPEQVKKAVVFGTSARKEGAQDVISEIKNLLEPKGIPIAEETFHCCGSFLLMNRGRPNAEDLKNAEEFAVELCGD